MGPVIQVGNINQVRAYFAEAASATAKFLANPKGRRMWATEVLAAQLSHMGER